MRVYEKFDNENFIYPEQMVKILTYLRNNGDLKVTGRIVERLYEEFSESRCASWLIVDHETLIDFADWLSKYEL